MATIYYRLSTKLDATGKSEILIRFIHGKKIDQFAKTGIYINPEYWDNSFDDAQKIGGKINIPFLKVRILNDTQTTAQQYCINAIEELNKITSIVLNGGEINGFTLNGYKNIAKEETPAEWLKNTIDKYNFPEKYEIKDEAPAEVTFFDLVSKFINEAPNRKNPETGRKLAPRSIVKYNATEKHLREFAKEQKRKDFVLSEIDKTFYEKFVSYLQKQGIKSDKDGNIISKGFTQNTVGKHIQVLKTMLNEAKIDNREFRAFSEETDTIYLNESELQTLKDVALPPYLERVRDCFLLLAWTGCRYGDLEKIGKTDIKDGFIAFRQEKTNNKVVIPLHPVVAEILEKYKYQLPDPITNQKFNEYIKEACKRAEIKSIETMTRTEGGKLETITFEKWENVTSHTGRRSFATNMYKRSLPSYMIMSVTGHRTEKSFLKYIKVKQHEHAEMMKTAWTAMYKS